MTGKKSLPQLFEGALDEIEQFRAVDPDKYLRCLRLLRDKLDEALSNFSKEQIQEARRKNQLNREAAR